MPAMTFTDILTKAGTPTGCGVLVVRRDGKVLTGTRKENATRGQICGPGGHIEPGETPKRAAKREAMEEFGIICNKLVPLGTQRTRGGYGTSAVFLCTDYIGKPMADEEEMTDARWMNVEEIKEQEVFPPFLRSLKLLPAGRVAKTFDTILKYNHNHDAFGRFASSPGGGGRDLSAYGKMIRTAPPPTKTITAYKAFIVKDGKLYPPMVANPGAMDTPVGVWLDAQEGTSAPPSKTGRPQVKAGGPGTKGGSGSLAYRPGWHLGDIPQATQFFTRNKSTGEKEMYENLVFAECKIAADRDYQKEAMSYGYTESGKFRHSYAGLPKVPTDGYYKYRTNPDPSTLPWYITGSMKVERILTDAEANKIVRNAGYEPMKRKGGELTQEKLDALMNPKVKKTDSEETNEMKSFKIYKTDEDQRLVFGWASVAITVDGETLEDRQHDMIEPEDLEEAAYEYVLNFRDTGEEHLPGYRKKGRLVESCVFTPEKQRAMGIPAGTLPVAWWIGFKIDDEDTWQRVKNGTYRMFSIEGKAERLPVEKADRTARTFEEVLKYNHNHDALGRFASSPGGGGRSYGSTNTGDAMAEVRSGKHNSLEKHMDANGNLTPEREKVHKEIIDKLLEGKVGVEGQATMTMLGGGPASGKSSVMSADTSGDIHAVTVDPDTIKKMLPGFEEMAKVDTNAAAFYHEESSALAKRFAEVAFSENYNVIYDGTGDGGFSSVQKKIDGARANGYRVEAKYVTIDTEEAVRRNQKRYDDAIAEGKVPRLPPEETVRKTHAKVTDVAVTMAPQFDHIEVWDNNGARGQQKKIAEGGNGQHLKVTEGNQEAFQRFLEKSNSGAEGFITLPNGQVVPVDAVKG